MDKNYNHHETEKQIYQAWEQSGAFNPDTQINADWKKSPYTILLPPPNANASLHAGHAMFVIEDILIRFHRMQGDPTLWLPGSDHAGFETQYVYEKHLSKLGKSRFDFDRTTFFNDVAQFVQNNSGLIAKQLKQMGFSLDWSRNTFMLDKKVVSIVYDTFKKMVNEGYVYRDNYIVNYSPKSGTTFSELEVIYKEQVDPLYYMKFGPVVIATVRPETKFRDTAVACHPDDPRYKDLIGKNFTFEGLLGPMTMTVIGDEEVDPNYGTGIMKVTPAHDTHDFQLGRKYNLPITPIIDFNGRMDFSWFINDPNFGNLPQKYQDRAQLYHGKKVAEARKLIVADMLVEGMIEKVDEKYVHNVAVDYKTGSPIEPMVMPNWFIATKKLAAPAIAAAREKKVTFVPDRFESMYYQWMENIRDWPISRQIVWGIRIPVWYDTEKNPTLSVTFLTSEGKRVTGTIAELTKTYALAEIKNGLQTLRAPNTATFEVSVESPGESYLPETDTFDTWFSSGQWPLTTLGFPDGKDFARFYPTQVLDTMWDILFFWVARMIMFGIYQTGKVPFSTVYLHSMVTDEKGAKMSKSKGNVIDPITLVEKYGADALRIALVAGSAPGNPIALSENKVRGYRNFSNKLWNMVRLYVLHAEARKDRTPLPEYSLAFHKTIQDQEHKQIITELLLLTNQTTDSLQRYRFSDAAQGLYDFTWNRVCDVYLEKMKEKLSAGDQETLVVTRHVLGTLLKLIHPFMPFVTETLWAKLHPKEGLLITTAWPK